jgi:hypothetical protein
MVRAHSPASALSVMPGNSRRSSTAAASSLALWNAARMAAASASVTENMLTAWEGEAWAASQGSIILLADPTALLILTVRR